MSAALVQVPAAFLFICTAAQVGGEVGSEGSSWACVNTRRGSGGESGYFPVRCFEHGVELLKTLDALSPLSCDTWSSLFIPIDKIFLCYGVCVYRDS